MFIFVYVILKLDDIDDTIFGLRFGIVEFFGNRFFNLYVDGYSEYLGILK